MKKIYSLFIAAIIGAAPVFADEGDVQAVLDLGDFEGSELQISRGQAWEQAPFNFFYEYSGAQVIYKSAEIAPLFEHGAKIQSISFRYGDPEMNVYLDVTATLDCYLQLIDDEIFPKIGNEQHWFKPAEDIVTAVVSLNYEGATGDDCIVTFTFDNPFEITSADSGKNLLVTTSSMLTSEEAQYFRAYVYPNDDRDDRMATYGQDKISSFQSLVDEGAVIKYEYERGSASVFKTDLPVARIEYTYNPSSAVENIEVAPEAPAVYYNLQGIRVSNPENGVYLRVKGGKADKVRF